MEPQQLQALKEKCKGSGKLLRQFANLHHPDLLRSKTEACKALLDRLCSSDSFKLMCKVVSQFDKYEQEGQMDVKTFCKSILPGDERQKFMEIKSEQLRAFSADLSSQAP